MIDYGLRPRRRPIILGPDPPTVVRFNQTYNRALAAVRRKRCDID
jgi:hypothetical protein